MKAINVLYYALFVIEIVSFLTGVLFLKKNKSITIKYFVAYLGIIVFCELLYDILLQNDFLFQNLYAYFVIPFEFLFFHWIYYQFSTNKEKQRIIFCAVIYGVAFFIEKFFLTDASKFVFFSFSYSVGNVVLLFVVFQYFIKLINSERILYFYQEHLFWISCGLLLFYLGTSPYYGLYNYLKNNRLEILYGYAYVMYFLNCSMYLLFAASFIWGKEK
jgi:hypothetical protein